MFVSECLRHAWPGPRPCGSRLATRHEGRLGLGGTGSSRSRRFFHLHALANSPLAETAHAVGGLRCMEMPDFKPVQPPSGQTRRLLIACVTIFILLAFAFAYWINMPE